MRRFQQASTLSVLLQLVVFISIQYASVVSSLSISSNSGNSKNSLTASSTNGGNARSVQQQQQFQFTTMPPLITTISQNNYLDSLAQQQSKQQQQQIFDNLHQIGEQHKAANDAEQHSTDDTVPLATINNHSRNNQPMARPPQYVDVSALVGRDRNSTSSPGSPLIGHSAIAQNSTSGLSPKSRSGLPECATQQVCNAIFVRMNYTQKLCECSSNYNWKCSHNLDPQDGHTIELTRKFDKRIYTQIKTCEPLREVRACKAPTDWTLLALQSERSGKAHYVVVCKCPTWAQLEGPYTHNHPPYANIPGIRVYGMLCAHQTARSSAQTYATYNPALSIYPEFPWPEALSVLNTTNLLSTLDSH